MVPEDLAAPEPRSNGTAPIAGNGAQETGTSAHPSPLPAPVSEGSGSGTPTGFQRFPVHNKLLDHVVRTPGRHPSPQPTHLGIPGGTHRVLSEEGPGYVAEKFAGKQKQMEQGTLISWMFSKSGCLSIEMKPS